VFLWSLASGRGSFVKMVSVPDGFEVAVDSCIFDSLCMA